MPKVSTKQLNCTTKQGNRVYLNIEIMYSETNGFYSLLHSEYEKLANTLTDEVKEKYGLETFYSKKRDHTGKPMVSGKSPEEVKRNYEVLINYLLNLSVKERPVILIQFDDDPGYNSETDLKGLREFTGMRFGFVYATESDLGGDSLKTYYNTYSSIYGGDNTRKVDIRISQYRGEVSEYTILDDTPELRAFLETTYASFCNLRTALGTLCRQPEKLIELANSGAKLLKTNSKLLLPEDEQG